MRQHVAAAVNPISSATPEKTAKRNPRLQLFNVILCSVWGGMYLTEGFNDLRSKSEYQSEYHWAFDFLMAAAFLILATANGIRLLRVDKARKLAADADSVLRVTDSREP
jgi:hypothetical protein